MTSFIYIYIYLQKIDKYNIFVISFQESYSNIIPIKLKSNYRKFLYCNFVIKILQTNELFKLFTHDKL